MSDKHWAVFALRDIQTALDCEKYNIASFHIDDAIAAILSQDEQDAQSLRAANRGMVAGLTSLS